jgi:hypothetical protein
MSGGCLQDSQFQLLFIPVVYLVTNSVHHDGAFWGIRFPVGASSFDHTIVDMVEEYLEFGGHPVLEPGLQGLDLAVVLPAVVSEADRKFIKHTIAFGKIC